MSGFLDRHTIISSAELRGPRVHASDLMPVLFDNSERSLEVAERSLKLKILSKGLIVVNVSLMMTPMGLKLLERNPGFYSGNGVVPTYREDKAELIDQMVVPMENFAEAGIDKSRLDTYIRELESSISSVLPWGVGDTPTQLHEILVGGLERDDSPISQELNRRRSIVNRDELAARIRLLNFADSKAVPEFLASLPEEIRKSMRRYLNACYHCVGGNTVGAECGTSLSTLGEFNSPSVLLAGRDASPQQLVGTSTFTRAFWGYALYVAQSTVISRSMIDTISFEQCFALSEPLRDTNYRENYQAFLIPYKTLTASAIGSDDLDYLNEAQVVEMARNVANSLRSCVKEHFGAKATNENGYATTTDIALDSIGVASGVGTIYAPVFGLASRPDEASGRFEAANGLGDGCSGRLLTAIRSLPVDEARKHSLRDAVSALYDLELMI